MRWFAAPIPGGLVRKIIQQRACARLPGPRIAFKVEHKNSPQIDAVSADARLLLQLVGGAGSSRSGHRSAYVGPWDEQCATGRRTVTRGCGGTGPHLAARCGLDCLSLFHLAACGLRTWYYNICSRGETISALQGFVRAETIEITGAEPAEKKEHQGYSA